MKLQMNYLPKDNSVQLLGAGIQLTRYIKFWTYGNSMPK